MIPIPSHPGASHELGPAPPAFAGGARLAARGHRRRRRRSRARPVDVAIPAPWVPGPRDRLSPPAQPAPEERAARSARRESRSDGGTANPGGQRAGAAGGGYAGPPGSGPPPVRFDRRPHPHGPAPDPDSGTARALRGIGPARGGPRLAASAPHAAG